jgi:hypothetical protein
MKCLGHALELARATLPLTGHAEIEELAREKRLKSLRKELERSELSPEVFQQLHTTGGASQAGGRYVSRRPSEISGHVYRAVTGKPLADAVVTLESPTSPQGDKIQRTGLDGSYEFVGLTPGIYWVIAYRNGFVGSVYGLGASQNASKGLIFVGGRQKRADIDFRLTGALEITTLTGKALGNALPGGGPRLAYRVGSFSPCGKQFAFVVTGPDPEQVCLYDLASHGLKCVTGQGEWGPGDLNTGAIAYLAWNGGTLYAQPVLGGGPPFRVTPGGPRPLIPFPVTSPATQVFGPLPQAVLRGLLRGLDHEAGAVGDRDFIVTAWYGVLAMSTADGEDPYTIATGGRALDSFVFDPDRSLAYYPVPGRHHGAIVSFNLKARLYHTTELPFGEGLKLLDVKRESHTTLVAYTVDGPCVPKTLANGEDPRVLPNKSLPAAQSASVCLATIPIEQCKQERTPSAGAYAK